MWCHVNAPYSSALCLTSLIHKQGWELANIRLYEGSFLPRPHSRLMWECVSEFTVGMGPCSVLCTYAPIPHSRLRATSCTPVICKSAGYESKTQWRVKQYSKFTGWRYLETASVGLAHFESFRGVIGLKSSNSGQETWLLGRSRSVNYWNYQWF